MSGGFFRGTSADQDTRFSNKQAKLLKSQKFPPELDQLVDMTKVKMDVIRPWIANRTTEFLGFEDEVLINFIYGLLDGKEVDGKQIQIQLTGFMEKNTSKFMKELWSLLTSAQKNASGIPQQFLDAKAEETRKKKAETDRINHEIQKKKEQEDMEAEQERQDKISADMENAKVAAASGVSGKPSSGKSSLKLNPDDEPADRRSSRARGKNGDSRLSHDGGHSSLSHRVSSSRSRSQSFSVSRSPSRSPPGARRHRSQSLSRSPRPRRRSPSPMRRVRSIYSPSRRKRSPLYARSPRRRSRSPLRRRSPSPQRRRRSPSPPRRRRSPSPPRRRRSPSPPPRRRSPVPMPRRRSPSPLPRRRSPVPMPRRRSPSPLPRRRSPSPPTRKRSRTPPSRRSSPTRRLRSPAPRSPRHRKQSPVRSPIRQSPVRSPIRQSPVRSPRRRRIDSESPSQQKRSRSPQYRNNRNLGKEHSSHYTDGEPTIYQDRDASEKEENARKQKEHGRAGGGDIVETPHFYQNSPIHPRSPQRDARMRSKGPSKIPDLLPPYQSSPNQSPSHECALKMNKAEEKRTMVTTYDKGNVRDNPEPIKIPEQNTRFDRGEMPSRRDGQASEIKDYGPKRAGRDRDSPTDQPQKRTSEKRNRYEVSEQKRKQYHTYGSDSVDRRSDFLQRRMDIDNSYTPEGIEYGPGILDLGNHSPDHLVNRSGGNRVGTVLRSHIEYGNEEDVVGSRRSPSRDSYVDYDGNACKGDAVHKPTPKMELVKHAVHSGSDSEENGAYKRKQGEKRKAKRDELGGKYDDEDCNMSPRSSEEKRELKRRRKEEKRLRKEEKRRRREERHRKREERRASKAKAKALATVAPMEGDSTAAEESDDDPCDRDNSHHNYDEEMEDEQKRLEIELRRKALESLRAKKAISH